MDRIVLLSAGGTGGHLFPAEAVAHVLKARGWTVHLATDERALAYSDRFPATMHTVGSASPFGAGPVGTAVALARLATGTVAALGLIRRLKPRVAVGFGGYPTVPPMVAAWLARVPTVLQEQNAVLGRANRFLAPRVTAIASGQSRLAGGERLGAKVVHTGIPVRDAVKDAAAIPYESLTTDGPLRLLAFGGSQGARILAERVPQALAAQPVELRRRLKVTQQCRPEDLEAVRAIYAGAGIAAELQPFFTDLPKRIAESHIVVSRSGASTVAELAAIGRPAIMVPLPHALDQDQKANAMTLAEAGGGWTIVQDDFSVERLAAEIAMLAAEPERLADAAAAARRIGRLDAAERVADLVEQSAKGNRA